MSGTEVANSKVSGAKMLHTAVGLMHPDEVVESRLLSASAKREILAAWASDVHAVPDNPALRQLDNGAVVRVDDVLHALRRLDGDDGIGWAGHEAHRRTNRRVRKRLSSLVKFPLRRRPPDDDDDPPPCPAVIAPLPQGPLTSGEAVEPMLALAA